MDGGRSTPRPGRRARRRRRGTGNSRPLRVRPIRAGRVGARSIRALTANCPRIGRMKRLVLALVAVALVASHADRRRRRVPRAQRCKLRPRRLVTRQRRQHRAGPRPQARPTPSGAASGTRSRQLPGDPGSTPIRGGGDGPASANSSSGATSPGWLLTRSSAYSQITASRPTGVGTPLEDGSYTLDATGSAPGCKVQVTVKPMGGDTFVTILYGAACPHD